MNFSLRFCCSITKQQSL